MLIYGLFVWCVCCVSCLSGLGVICLVCLGCLSFLPTSSIASVLCTCTMYFHERGLTIKCKMLKDVGTTVPKSAERNKCSIYAATQGMKACNNNNMRNQN